MLTGNGYLTKKLFQKSLNELLSMFDRECAISSNNMNALHLDDEKEEKNLSIEANSLYISNCGSRFINGTYTRISSDCYVRECTHPVTNITTNIEFRAVANNPKYCTNTNTKSKNK